MDRKLYDLALKHHIANLEEDDASYDSLHYIGYILSNYSMATGISSFPEDRMARERAALVYNSEFYKLLHPHTPKQTKQGLFDV